MLPFERPAPLKVVHRNRTFRGFALAVLLGVLAGAACTKGAGVHESTIEERMRESRARADFAEALTMVQYDRADPESTTAQRSVAAARAEFMAACRACASDDTCEDEAGKIERDPKRAIDWGSACR